ncbi:MAG: flagellar export protein FliJ [Gallionellaceae bacterium]|nr:flagellar export protein FliJ [Gallionellaceae bacterium]
MAKPFSLQPLVHLAKKQNDAAIKNLGHLNQQQKSAQDKLVMLQQFRRDYQLKLQELSQKGMSPVDLRNFQDFIYRLDKAIEQQQSTVNLSNYSVSVGQGELKEAKRKMQSFDTLALRHIEAERKLEAKAEQKTQDEYAGRFAAMKLNERTLLEKELEEREHLLGASHE